MDEASISTREKGDVIMQHVGTTEQRADIFTKSMAKVKFEEMRSLLGVKNISVPELGGKCWRNSGIAPQGHFGNFIWKLFLAVFELV